MAKEKTKAASSIIPALQKQLDKLNSPEEIKAAYYFIRQYCAEKLQQHQERAEVLANELMNDINRINGQ
jgi:hypothetical protein